MKQRHSPLLTTYTPGLVAPAAITSSPSWGLLLTMAAAIAPMSLACADSKIGTSVARKMQRSSVDKLS
eukprot:579936-Prymnesium_polylepis.2